MKAQKVAKIIRKYSLNGEALKYFIFILFINTLLMPVSSTELTALNVETEIKKDSCEKEINKQLSSWNAGEEKWKAHLSEDGFTYVRPTKMMSVWIQFHKEKDKTILSKLTPENVTIITFDQKCSKTLQVTRTEPSKENLMNEVDDKKLYSLVNKNMTGLVYSWSPHMSLSLEGLRTIQMVSKKLKLPLIVLMDAGSEVEVARSRLQKERINLEEILPSTSMELYLRRTNVHYPNLVVFKNGKFIDGMLPGLSSASQYEEFIKGKVK